MISALTRSLVFEGITMIEKKILGEDIDAKESIKSIVKNTAIDKISSMVSSKIEKAFKANEPRNYSTYAKTLKSTSQNLTREEIDKSMKGYIKRSRGLCTFITYAVDFFAGLL